MIGICAALLLPGLVREGMFMDGMLYTVVAHNQANGFGTFWAPRFSQVGVAGMAIFHEHPPLAFGLQAWWFRVLGDGFWVERLYCLATALITMFVMVRLWRECLHEHLSLRPLGGWPLLLWIIVPQVFWCFHNNMLENTMAVFVTAAVLQVVLGMSAAWAKRAIIAGGFVFLASFTKGVPGLFPLAAPVLLWSASRNVHSFRRALVDLLGDGHGGGRELPAALAMAGCPWQFGALCERTPAAPHRCPAYRGTSLADTCGPTGLAGRSFGPGGSGVPVGPTSAHRTSAGHIESHGDRHVPDRAQRRGTDDVDPGAEIVLQRTGVPHDRHWTGIAERPRTMSFAGSSRGAPSVDSARAVHRHHSIRGGPGPFGASIRKTCA
ncbi:MAG: glycosyltransferase family 39 protein [Flavobacteriales bacterium]|nr:glycosyltransferase family 39 protein [Flavobacteriales bacterium]